MLSNIALVSEGPDRTRQLGRVIGRHIGCPAVVFLEGDLGAGKTHLSKGIFEGFGGKDSREIVSPSYTLVHPHDANGRPFYHVDLYRLEDPDHVLGLEYEDFLFDNPGLTVVEWPRSLRDLIDPGEVLDIRMTPGDQDEERKLEIRGETPRFEKLFAELARS